MKNLLWFGPVFSYSGYAMHNRGILFELHKLGWNIKLIPTEQNIPEHLIGKNLLLKMTKNNSIDPSNTICVNLIPPPALPYYSAYTILYTTLESLTIHDGYLRRCTQYDEVWVPCKANYKSFLRAGFPRKKLCYCPEGVYPQFWNSDETPNEKYKSNVFTFFYHGDWSYRKGLDILLRAYSKAFLPTEPVRLLLLVHYQGREEEFSRLMIGQDINYILKKHDITKLPKIDFIFEHVPDPGLPSIYKCANVYVAPTRGEAWGLPIIQAMSCGLPAIVPKWGGHMDYCTSKNSYLTNIEKFDYIHDKVNLTVDFYWYQKFCFPDVNDFAKKMRYCYEHPTEVQKKGQYAREYVQKYFSWEKAGKIAEKRLTKIYERLNR